MITTGLAAATAIGMGVGVGTVGFVAVEADSSPVVAKSLRGVKGHTRLNLAYLMNMAGCADVD